MFWLAVSAHKRKDKGDGWLAYQDAVCLLDGEHEDVHAFLLERATAYYGSPLGKTKYCHGAGPFLRQRNYDDDPAAWERDPDNSHGQPSLAVNRNLPYFDEELPHERD